jgi:hypothetical protein
MCRAKMYFGVWKFFKCQILKFVLFVQYDNSMKLKKVVMCGDYFKWTASFSEENGGFETLHKPCN